MGSCFEIYILKCIFVFGILVFMFIVIGIKNLDFYIVNRVIGVVGFNIKRYILILMY